MNRSELWKTGKPIDWRTDNTRCGRYGCREHKWVREFDFGFFCKEHFMKAPECTTPGCHNPAVIERKPDGDPRCRVCQFEYEGELEIYTENMLADAPIWAP